MSHVQEMRYRTNCPFCQGERNCIIKGEAETRWTDPDSWVFGGNEHRLIQCNGCDTIFYESKSWFSENIETYVDDDGNEHEHVRYNTETYPSKPARRPEWLHSISLKDETLFGILEEVYKAIDSECYILAAIGLRTAFDRTSEYLSINESLGLEKKVHELFKQGYIGETEREQLLLVTNAGSAAAHRGWSPASGEFRALLAVAESFISRTVLKDSSLLELKEKIPQRRKP
ncbi:hypothetical protein L585_13985 [Pantoea ananatis BRT175]|uniref:DUF4145 domain-containing protein n=1 Tax=Pantoea ananas TaxID=553 RepID=UPI0003B21DCB|nr:DUF4145 domain-containing protein [Pantoea ananatis]ERM13364.1 hypothetical protein L585_13985 [Pantoea ananatis BRT175]